MAYTRAGEGILSNPIYCVTEEAVPDAPEKIKAVVKSESSVIISWQPPRKPNGVLTKYTVYLRVLEKGQEVKIVKNIVPSHINYYEVNELNTRESYEAWVTSSTKIGQGPSTPVVKLLPSALVPSAIVSFGRKISVPWRIDVKLACVYVGVPRPTW
jgi:Down syndrome cell adhesion molecule